NVNYSNIGVGPRTGTAGPLAAGKEAKPRGYPGSLPLEAALRNPTQCSALGVVHGVTMFLMMARVAIFAPMMSGTAHTMAACRTAKMAGITIGLMILRVLVSSLRFEDLRRKRDEWRDQAKRLVLPAPQPPAETPSASERPSRLRRAWRWMRATG